MTDRQKELEAVKSSRTWLFMTTHCDNFHLEIWTKLGKYYKYYIVKVGNDWEYIQESTEKQ